MRRLALVLVPLIALAAACGGGGGGASTPPVVNPAPSTPAPVVSQSAVPLPQGSPRVLLSWNGPAHSLGATSSAFRLPMALALIEPIAQGVKPSPGALDAGNQPAYGSTVIVTEVNVLGTPIPVVSPNVTVPSAVATVQPQPIPSTAPSGSAWYGVASTTGTPTRSTVSVTTGDGASASIALNTYPFVGFGSFGQTEAPFAIASNADGSFSTVSSPSAADVYVTAPSSPLPSPLPGMSPLPSPLPGPFQAGTQTVVHFPYGYQDLGPGGFSTVLTAIGFTSQGTSELLSAFLFAASPSHLFKTHDGRFVKFWTESGSCGATRPDCPDGGYVHGIYLVSDTTGTFAY